MNSIEESVAIPVSVGFILGCVDIGVGLAVSTSASHTSGYQLFVIDPTSTYSDHDSLWWVAERCCWWSWWLLVILMALPLSLAVTLV